MPRERLQAGMEEPGTYEGAWSEGSCRLEEHSRHIASCYQV